MSLQSIGNSLSLQQIMQLLQQQSLGAADPEAAAAGEARTPVPAGQNVPADQPQPEEHAAPGAQLAPAKPTLDPATIKTLLAIQEAQTRASDDVLLFGNGAPSGDPLLDASGSGSGTQDPLAAAVGQFESPQAAQAPDLTAVDPAQLQSLLAAMSGSAASGDAIASVTERIMDLLEGGAAAIGAVEE